MSGTNTDAQRGLSQNISHGNPTVPCDRFLPIIYTSTSPEQLSVFYFMVPTAKATLRRIIVTSTFQNNVMWQFPVFITKSVLQQLNLFRKVDKWPLKNLNYIDSLVSWRAVILLRTASTKWKPFRLWATTVPIYYLLLICISKYTFK